MLSLHKFFIRHSRPVPNFIVLDQPSQAFFPSNIYYSMDGTIIQNKDQDIESVERIYNLFFDICEELSPNFQIIVLDHANLANEKFQSSLIGDSPWDGSKALIPPEWIGVS
jgi:hypothetical protein